MILYVALSSCEIRLIGIIQFQSRLSGLIFQLFNVYWNLIY